MSNTWVCTTYQVYAEIKTGTATPGTADFQFIYDAIGFVSDRIETIQDYPVEPYDEPHYYDALGQHINTARRSMQLERPLLEVGTITLASGSVLGTAEYFLSPRGQAPYTEIVLTNASLPYSGWYPYNYPAENYVDAILVNGKWGYRTRYEREAWGSASVTGGTVTSSATTVTVASLANFAPGNLARIDDEYMRVTAVDSAGTALTVQRGIRGTVASAHGSAALIDVFSPDPTVQRAAIKWAALLYKRRGDFVQTQFDEAGAILQWPKDAPNEVMNILSELPDYTLWTAV